MSGDTRKEEGLITDAWSRKIMGFHVADHLKATGPIEALKMAMRNRLYPKRKLMHHSETIKNEFELDKPLPDTRYATGEITKTIEIYNQLRPHLSCGMHTPDQMHHHINSNPKKPETNNMWERIFLDNFN